MKNSLNLKNISNILLLFIIFRIIIELDGNISLRYFTDDLSKVYDFGDNLPISIEGVLFAVSIFIIFIKKIVQSKDFSKSTYIKVNYMVFSGTLFLALIFFRILDIERLYLLIFIITYPLLDYFIFEYRNYKFGLIHIVIMLIILLAFPLISEEVNLEIAEEDVESLDITSLLETNPTKLVSRFDISNNYEIDKFKICCEEVNFYNLSGKTTGYLQVVNDKLLHVNGFGIFSLYSVNDFYNGISQSPKIIKTNLDQKINNTFVFNLKNWESIKDALIIDETVYLSYLEEFKEDCVNIKIVKAKYNESFLNFEDFYSKSECVNRNISPYNAHQSGGKLLDLQNGFLLLTTGDFRNYSKAQDLDSYLGKTIKINLTDSTDSTVSYGHRNPQGIALTKEQKYLISTEHGPRGGDEINIINLDILENFGWPIASYGVHYAGGFIEDAPLKKSHKDYGFVEPVWFYTHYQNDVHGISDITINHFSEENSFFVATLKATLLYEINVDLKNNKLLTHETFKVGERIRDIQYYEPLNIYFLLLEETPSIALLKLKNTPSFSKPTIILD